MATVTISLPDHIATKVDTEAKIKGFSTRSEFVRSLIRKYFSGEELSFETYETRPMSEVKLELAKTGKYSEAFIESVTSGLKKSTVHEG